MLRQVAILLVLLLGSSAQIFAALPLSSAGRGQNPLRQDLLARIRAHEFTARKSLAPAEREAARCCRICNRGRACGDGCISRERRCHRPPGCACDQ